MKKKKLLNWRDFWQQLCLCIVYQNINEHPSVLNKMLILDLVTGLNFFFYLNCFECCKASESWSFVENNSTEICICPCTVHRWSLSMAAEPSEQRRESNPGASPPAVEDRHRCRGTRLFWWWDANRILNFSDLCGILNITRTLIPFCSSLWLRWL